MLHELVTNSTKKITTTGKLTKATTIIQVEKPFFPKMKGDSYRDGSKYQKGRDKDKET